MGIAEALTKQGVRIFGSPPATGASKVESWKYVRRIYIRLLPFAIPLWVLVALNGGPAWLWIVLGISAATWLVGFISVHFRIRRLSNKSTDG